MSNSINEFNNSFAVIIGINEYKYVDKLKTAVADAEELKKILETRHTALKKEYQEKNKYDVLLLKDEEATKTNLTKLLNSFQKGKIWCDKDGKTEKTVNTNDRLLFYFAGHGVALDAKESQEGPVGYFIPQDAEDSKVETYLPMQELHDALNKLKCRHMLAILDCCFAGAFHWVTRDIRSTGKVYKERYDRFIQDRAWQVITSAAYDQKALDFVKKREPIQDGKKVYSPFAKALFEALSQESKQQNADANNDGIITTNELYLYLRDKVESADNNGQFQRQTPGYCPLRKHDKGEFIFLLPSFDINKLEKAPPINKKNNPYRGLESYEEEHSDFFFGRDKAITELYKKVNREIVNQNALTVVVGASGIGKSSLVNAGLIPNWRREQLNYLEEKLKGLQKQIDDYREQEEQLEKSIKLNEQKEELEKEKERLEDLNAQENELKEILNKLKKRKMNQSLLDWKKEFNEKITHYLVNSNEIITSSKQEEVKTKLENWLHQHCLLETFNNQVGEAKTIYFLDILQDRLENLQKQLKIEFHSNLKEDLQRIADKIAIEIKNLIEEKYNNIEIEKNIVKNLQQQLELIVKKSRKQLEIQAQWYTIRLRLGKSPIKALNDSLDQVLRFATPNQADEQAKENKTTSLNKNSNKSNWIEFFFSRFSFFEKPNTSTQIQSSQGENKEKEELDRRLDEWKNYNSTRFGEQRLLVIDQFEELFTVCQDDEEQKNFLNWLAYIINKNSEWLRIVLIVRSEFELQIQKSDLNKYWTEAQFLVEKMTRSELQQAIEGPATPSVINFEKDENGNYLLDKLLDEVGQIQGALPLLSLILHELYNKLSEKNYEERRTLTLKDYEELGGVAEVLTNKLESEYEKFVLSNSLNELLQNVRINFQNACNAIIFLYFLVELQEARAIDIFKENDSFHKFEASYNKFEELYKENEAECQTREKAIRNLMLRMVAMDTQLARRPVSMPELKYSQSEDKQIERAIEAFVNARLLMKEGDIVEPVHDFIVLKWSRLRTWIEDANKNMLLSLRRRLTEDALDWVNNKKEQNYLWHYNPRLELLEKVVNSDDNWLNQLENEFVKESLTYKQVVIKAEQEYNKLVNSAQPDQNLQSSDWEKTIRNVMLRMVVIDSNLAYSHQRVLMSELVYPKPEENKRVNQVIKAFVSVGLFLKEPPNEEIYVTPVDHVLMQDWKRLWEWKLKHKEDLVLLRQLTKAAMDWQNNGKEQNYLWHNDHRLELLEKVVKSGDNWLNQLENEFVQKSLTHSQIVIKAEQLYKEFVNSKQLNQNSQSPDWEKTIRNVMLRMVVVDKSELTYRPVLMSELMYPEPENKQVNQVVEAFVRKDLFLKEQPNEEIYVKPVDDALMQEWNRLWIWKLKHKGNLILLRQLTKAAMDWQNNGKEQNYLWHNDHRLELLEKVVNSDDNWLNQLENEFVKKSIEKKRSDLTRSPVLRTLPLLVLPVTLVFWILSSTQRTVEHQIAKPVISRGEEILTSPNKFTWLKLTGTKAIATGNFDRAVKYLKEYREKQPNDPEALIYLNNAIIGNGKSYTIATSVPISSDINGALEMLRGVAQAQDEINSKEEGINGVPLRVLIADDNNNPDVAKQIAEKFIQDSRILGVVGHYSSDATLAASEIYKGGKLVAISPVSTSVRLKGFSNYLFRTVPNDAVAARTLVDYMLNQLGKKKAAIFYSSKSEYSQSLKKEFLSAIPSIENQLVFDLSNSDFDPNVEPAIKQGAEVLVLLANTKELDNALKVVKANRQQLPLLAGDDVYTPKVLKEGAEDAVGMIVSVPWHILAESESNFAETSKKIWQGAEVNWRTAMSYDATLSLISAIKRNPTREGIAKTLISKNFTVKGATGEIEFLNGERFQPIQLVKIVKTGSPSKSGYGYDFIPESK